IRSIVDPMRPARPLLGKARERARRSRSQGRWSVTKIAFLSCVMHGDNPRALLLMRSLRDAGPDVVALMARAKASSPSDSHGIRHIDLRAPRSNFVAGGGIRSLLRAVTDRIGNAWRLYKLVIAERPDACICHEPDSWLVGLLAKRK